MIAKNLEKTLLTKKQQYMLSQPFVMGNIVITQKVLEEFVYKVAKL